LKAGVCD